MKKPRCKKTSKPTQSSDASGGPPFECIALLLQGGGALGAYQAGVYQALAESQLEPDWVGGISIGAVNAAIIAGNAPAERVSKLREFWEAITYDAFQYHHATVKAMMTRNDDQLRALNFMSALRSAILGVPGFFSPRPLNPWWSSPGAPGATSFYDFSDLHATLEGMIDFDRLNNKAIRFSIGAVNVTSGNFTVFDNRKETITAAHILASGALPPGFPPVEIDGQYYWDGGLISNTPLQWVIEDQSYQDTLIFQVDLWSADGSFPQNMAEALTREKDIRYSSRTRANTDRFKEKHRLCHAVASLLEKLPDDMRHLPEVKLLSEHSDEKLYNIVHLIYHNKSYEGYSKDFEFSRLGMEAHWLSGYTETQEALKHPQVLRPPENQAGISVFDFSRKK